MSCASSQFAANARCCEPTKTPTCAPQQNPFSAVDPQSPQPTDNPMLTWDANGRPASLLPPVSDVAAGLYQAYAAQHP